MSAPRLSPPPGRPAAQRGISLVWTAVLITVIGLAMTAGYLLIQAGAESRQARQQDAALAWAGQLLDGYASAFGRLPCPASTADGLEDCGANPNGKGWLPMRTLEQHGALALRPDLQASRPEGTAPAIRYLVYRDAASGLDLARQGAPGADSRYRAKRPEYKPSAPAAGDYYVRDGDQSSTADLCQALHAISPLQLPAATSDTWQFNAPDARAGTTAAAHVRDPGGRVVNVAYGLATAGKGSGAGLFGGANATAANTLEWPARAHDAQYGDRVRVAGAAQLARTLQCAPVMASLDAMAASRAAMEQVVAQRVENVASASSARTSVLLAYALNTAGLLGDAAAIKTAVSNITVSSVFLGNAVAGCASIILAPGFCWQIPIHTAALTTAKVALVQASAALAMHASMYAPIALADAQVKEATSKLDGKYGAPDSEDPAICSMVDAITEQQDEIRREADENRAELAKNREEMARLRKIIEDAEKEFRNEPRQGSSETHRQEIARITAARIVAEQAYDAVKSEIDSIDQRIKDSKKGMDSMRKQIDDIDQDKAVIKPDGASAEQFEMSQEYWRDVRARLVEQLAKEEQKQRDLEQEKRDKQELLKQRDTQRKSARQAFSALQSRADSVEISKPQPPTDAEPSPPPIIYFAYCTGQKTSALFNLCGLLIDRYYKASRDYKHIADAEPALEADIADKDQQIRDLEKDKANARAVCEAARDGQHADDYDGNLYNPWQQAQKLMNASMHYGSTAPVELRND
ncbi:hypothetical protein [Bordetella bronchiseptica]|uniref:hypothetical protein n=1 Tax=Bordetella bronchiseptica TaxID=518 RepID=UPI000459AB76|nr:hypothetical protein [Bordetella bronchiseptica]KAK76329.1 hypothetical protein L530_0788 [Bordetella bronchiseptica MO211]